MLLQKTGLLVALLLYLWITLEPTSGDISCPERIPCSCYGKAVTLDGVEYQRRILNCSHRNLHALPNLLPLFGRFYHQVLLNGNSISFLPKFGFTHLRVRTIDLSDNPIRSVSDNAFAGLVHVELRELFMRNCSLTSSPLALRILTKLHRLDLSNNRITRLNPISVRNMVDLVELDISGNIIRFPNQLPYKYPAFTRMKKLEKVNMSYNGLYNMPSVVLNQWPSIAHLDLSHNRIASANSEDFRLKHLHRCDLSYNVISEVNFIFAPNIKHLDLRFNPLTVTENPPFDPLWQLRTLQLSHCHIPFLQAAFFPINNNISHFTITWCNLTNIEERLFHRFQRLTYLDLSGNPLFILEKFFSGLENTLRVLHINEMDLGPVVFSHLTKLNVLKYLYANRNDIRRLPIETMAGTLKPHMHVYLDDNKISKIHPKAFDVLWFPVHIYMRRNRITDLSFIVTQPCKFVGLRLDISDNPILCDCELFKTEDMKVLNLTGTCAYPGNYKGKKLSWRPKNLNRDDYFLPNAAEMCLFSSHFAQRFECTCGKWLRYDNHTRCASLSLLAVNCASNLSYQVIFNVLLLSCLAVLLAMMSLR